MSDKSANIDSIPNLEIKLTMSVLNKTTSRGYSLSAQGTADFGDERQVTLLNLVEEIMNVPVTKEIREVEGWPA